VHVHLSVDEFDIILCSELSQKVIALTSETYLVDIVQLCILYYIILYYILLSFGRVGV